MTQARQELMNALEDLSELYPEWRMGQMLTNIATWARGPTASAIWDVEDEELVDVIRKHINNKRSK